MPTSRILPLLFLLLPVLGFAQSADSLRLLHIGKDMEVKFGLGDEVKVLTKGFHLRRIEGTVTAIDTGGITLAETRVPFQNIHYLMPLTKGAEVQRSLGLTALALGSGATLFFASVDEDDSALPYAGLGAGLLAYKITQSCNRYNLHRTYAVQVGDTIVKPYFFRPKREVPGIYVPPKPPTQIAAHLPKPDSLFITNWQVKLNFLQFINKEFNIAVEHHNKGRISQEYGFGIVHPTFLGMLARGLFYAENLSSHTTGVSGRFQLKFYPKTRNLKQFHYLGPEFKYRFQTGNSNIIESASDYAYRYRFSHQRHEFQFQFNKGILLVDKPHKGVFEVMIGYGLSIQHRKTSYSNYQAYYGAPYTVPTPTGLLDMDNGWFVLPRLQMSVIFGGGWNAKKS